MPPTSSPSFPPASWRRTAQKIPRPSGAAFARCWWFDRNRARSELNRWLPLVKWLLAIPHYLLRFLLYIGVFFAVIAWFAIPFTGRYPRAILDYVEGAIRWHNRVAGYAFILVTDRFPPFRLSA